MNHHRHTALLLTVYCNKIQQRKTITDFYSSNFYPVVATNMRVVRSLMFFVTAFSIKFRKILPRVLSYSFTYLRSKVPDPELCSRLRQRACSSPLYPCSIFENNVI